MNKIMNNPLTLYTTPNTTDFLTTTKIIIIQPWSPIHTLSLQSLPPPNQEDPRRPPGEFYLMDSGILVPVLSCLKYVAVDAPLSFLRRWGAGGVENLIKLEENAGALSNEMRVLKEIRDDLETKIQNLERQPGMRRTYRVAGWLKEVDAVHGQVHIARDSLTSRTTFLERCSFDSLRSGWVLGGRVADLLKLVRVLRGQRDDLDNQLVDEEPPAAAIPVPSKSARIVGGGEKLSEIRSLLRNDKVGIIGIYGMGGVGKTTLLKEINNQFLEKGSRDFDVVIWVTVSSKPDVFKIQEDIGVRLGFSRRGDAGRPLPEDKDDRRDALCSTLDHKRFLLLLDDMWEALDLEEIGIPHPNSQNSKGKKIVFTTRSEAVCADMDVRQAKIKMGFLSEEESWELFCSKVDARVDLENNAGILQQAKTVVGKCGGLPLTLIAMGRAMSNATRVGEWRQAVEKLKEAPYKIRGMKDVLSLLRFSFDNLEDDITRECLLYCALFPEDYNIRIMELVDYWVGEGFLDDHSPGLDTLSEARDRGDCIIGKLKDACLLESGEDEFDEYVKMHDVVREMALWLTGEELAGRGRFIVGEGERGLARLADANTWENAKRVSIIQGGALKLPSLKSHCHGLSTVLICDRLGTMGIELMDITQNFCESIPALRVLDLSGTDVQNLPDAIGLLTELRHLGLSRTRITRLPKELGKLVKLRQLDLRDTEIVHIPREAILTLSSLQRLALFWSAYRWEGDDLGGAKLSDLDRGLGQLEELSLDVRALSCLETLANSENLGKSAVGVGIEEVTDLTSSNLSAALGKLKKLRWLDIVCCPALEELRVDCCDNQLQSLKQLMLLGLDQVKEVIGVGSEGFTGVTQRGGRRVQRRRPLHPPLFPSLRRLDICFCPQLKDLRWVGRLPLLELLSLRSCQALEELLVGDEPGGEAGADDDHDSSSFPRLKSMDLGRLPLLRSIGSGRPLLFSSLKGFYVSKCPHLKRLPVRHGSCPKIEVIIAEQDWWDALEWDDQDASGSSSSHNTRSALAPFFQPW